MKRKSKLFYWEVPLFLILFLGVVNIASAQNFASMYKSESDTSNATLESVGTEALLKQPLEETEGLSKMMDSLPIEMGLSDPSKYTLGPMDVIEITVLRHPEFSGTFEINNEGNIQYEYIGDIKVSDATKDELKDILTSLLADYIIAPELTIKILQYNSKIVYVIGEVAIPGKIFMKGDAITIREALVQAGLPLLSAATRKCRLITPTKNGKASLIYVNVFSLLYEGDLRENYIMKPGDTLYIPATVMAKAMRVISPVTQPMQSSAGAARTVTTGF